MMVTVQIAVFVTPGAEMIVGGLCLLADGRCLALGDLLSLRAVTGDTEAWCLRLPGRIVVCCCVVLSASRCFWLCPLGERGAVVVVAAVIFAPAMVVVVVLAVLRGCRVLVPPVQVTGCRCLG